MKSTFHRNFCAQALWPALAVALATPAVAQTNFASAGNSRADASGFGQSLSRPTVFQSSIGPVAVGAVSSASYAFIDGVTGSMNALAQTTSQTALGGLHLQAYTRVEVLNGNPLSGELGYTVAEATGQFADRFILNVPGYAAGALFTITAGVDVSALNTMTSVMDNNIGRSTSETTAAWTSRVTVSSTSSGQQLAERYDNQSCSRNQFGAGCSGTGAGWRTFSFVMPNQSWAAQVVLTGWSRSVTQANLRGGGNAYVTSLADMSHTIAWGGISQVLDPTGAAVGNFSALSTASGFDWRNAYVSAVPEPTTALLLLAGLTLIGGWKRRR